MYAQQIEGDSWRDAKMDKSKIDKMSGVLGSIGLWHFVTDDFMRHIDQQIAQLYELMQAIRNQEPEESDPEHKPE